MGSAISLRSDFRGDGLRILARQTKDADQARRLLALASIYDGGSRADAARLGSVTVQIVRDWVVRFTCLRYATSLWRPRADFFRHLAGGNCAKSFRSNEKS